MMIHEGTEFKWSRGDGYFPRDGRIDLLDHFTAVRAFGGTFDKWNE